MKTNKRQKPQSSIVSAYRKVVINQFIANPYFASLEQRAATGSGNKPSVAEKRRMGGARVVSFAAPCTASSTCSQSLSLETQKQSENESC